MTTIIGIDPSLTRTGLAIIDEERIGVHVFHVQSTGRKDASLTQRAQRVDDIWHRLYESLIRYQADFQHGLAIIEGPAYNSRQGAQHDRSGLWWHLVRQLHRAGSDVIEVAPAVRARYATGKGNAGKDEVLAQVVRRYPDVFVSNNDEADALVLAAIGARLIGSPVDDPMPKTHLAALAKIPTLQRNA